MICIIVFLVFTGVFVVNANYGGKSSDDVSEINILAKNALEEVLELKKEGKKSEVKDLESVQEFTEYLDLKQNPQNALIERAEIFGKNVEDLSSEELTFDLEPSTGTEKVFDNVTLTIVDEESYVISVNNELEFFDDTYHTIFFNAVDETYTAIEVDMEIDLTNYEKNILEPYSPELTNTGDYWFMFRAITRDPAFIEVVRTEHDLDWNSGGGYVSRDGRCIAQQPSAAGTNWYTDSCVFTQLDDTANSVTSELDSSYYNYDFLDSSERTDVDHTISIQGNANGTVSYEYTATHSGYMSWLLFTGIGYDTNALVN